MKISDYKLCAISQIGKTVIVIIIVSAICISCSSQGNKKIINESGVKLPDKATAPSPSNRATNIPITHQLSWTNHSSENESCDIYFGTSNPPPYQTSRTCDCGGFISAKYYPIFWDRLSYLPGLLSFNTTYYWRIDFKNPIGVTTGDIWSFTTIPPSSPDRVITATPVNGISGITITPELWWYPPDNTVSYDVYLGVTTTNWTPITNTTRIIYDTDVLYYDTTYFWRIDSKNSAGTTKGNIWSFITHKKSITSFIKVEGGYFYTIALKSDGTLWAWGANDRGQLGDGTTINKNIPTKIGTDTNWSTIATGYNTTFAIKTDGTLWVWGDGYGNKPSQIGTDTNWFAVDSSYYCIIALKTDGTIWAWGWNIFGQLGDGTNVDKNIPTKIGTDTKWLAIAAGFNHFIALKNDGTLWAWGDGYGNKPSQIGIDTNWSTIAASKNYSIALKTNGTLWVLRADASTQIGKDTDWSAVSISRGFSNAIDTFALKKNGTLWAWGDNYEAEPCQIGIDKNWSFISAGEYHTIALKTDGTVWGLGFDSYGALGEGGRRWDGRIERFTKTPRWID
jgi:alpha-tubulin suppressor-like RCC1 family protein